MEKEIYTPMEKILIEAMKTYTAMEAALKLDLMLLEAEAQVGLMDGLPVIVEEAPANEQ